MLEFLYRLSNELNEIGQTFIPIVRQYLQLQHLDISMWMTVEVLERNSRGSVAKFPCPLFYLARAGIVTYLVTDVT